MSAKRYPRAAVKAAAKKLKPKAWDGQGSEPHQVVAEAGQDFTAEEWALVEEAVHSAIARHEDTRRWALVSSDHTRAKKHADMREGFKALLGKVQAKRALRPV